LDKGQLSLTTGTGHVVLALGQFAQLLLLSLTLTNNLLDLLLNEGSSVHIGRDGLRGREIGSSERSDLLQAVNDGLALRQTLLKGLGGGNLGLTLLSLLANTLLLSLLSSLASQLFTLQLLASFSLLLALAGLLEALDVTTAGHEAIVLLLYLLGNLSKGLLLGLLRLALAVGVDHCLDQLQLVGNLGETVSDLLGFEGLSGKDQGTVLVVNTSLNVTLTNGVHNELLELVAGQERKHLQQAIELEGLVDIRQLLNKANASPVS
jgi:hypothetical protein